MASLNPMHLATNESTAAAVQASAVQGPSNGPLQAAAERLQPFKNHNQKR